MTIEKRCFISADSVLALEIVCPDCKLAMTYRIEGKEQKHSLPSGCASCGKRLSNASDAILRRLITAIRDAREISDLGVRIEVEPPE